MKFLFDHDVPDETAYGLVAMGHEVFKLRELISPLSADEDVDTKDSPDGKSVFLDGKSVDCQSC